MAVTGSIGYTNLFKIDADGAATYTTLAGVMDINGPNMSADAIDVTTTESSNRHREFIKGMINGGTVDVDLLWDPSDTSWDTLVTIFRQYTFGASSDNGVGYFEIEWTNNTEEATFEGVITDISPAAPLEDKLTCTISIQVSGQPTLQAIV